MGTARLSDGDAGNLSGHPKYSWLVGYPKSGTTWFSFMLWGLHMNQSPESWGDVAACVPNWDRVYHSGWRTPIGWVRAHSTHNTTQRANPDRVIFVVRNPLDIMLSHYGYLCRNEPGYEYPLDGYVEKFIHYGGHKPNEVISTGTWCENVESWLALSEQRSFDFALVRYEDLITDTRTELMRLFPDSAACFIDRAIKMSSIQSMLSLDNDHFMGSGGSTYAEILTAKQIADANVVFGKTMRILGY